jgi:hypothetical protein
MKWPPVKGSNHHEYSYLHVERVQGWTEDAVCRRLISLIFADWLPHDNWFVGSCLGLETRISALAAL